MQSHLTTFKEEIKNYPEGTFFEVPEDVYSHSQKIVPFSKAVELLSKLNAYWEKNNANVLFSVRNVYKKYPIIINGIRENKMLVVVQTENQFKY